MKYFTAVINFKNIMFVIGMLLAILFLSSCNSTTKESRRYFYELDCGCFNNQQIFNVSSTKSMWNSGDTITIYRYIDHMRNNNQNWLLDRENRRLDTIYSITDNHLLEIEYKTCIIQ